MAEKEVLLDLYLIGKDLKKTLTKYLVKRKGVMTAKIARIQNDDIRQMLWVAWFPLGVYLDLWWRFRNSKSFNELVWASWDLGWNGLK